MRKRTHGYCAVISAHGNVFHLRRDQYAQVRKAWLEKVPSIDVVGLHGDRATLKVGDIEGIWDISPEAFMSSVNESRADEADDSLAGGAV